MREHFTIVYRQNDICSLVDSAIVSMTTCGSSDSLIDSTGIKAHVKSMKGTSGMNVVDILESKKTNSDSEGCEDTSGAQRDEVEAKEGYQ